MNLPIPNRQPIVNSDSLISKYKWGSLKDLLFEQVDLKTVEETGSDKVALLSRSFSEKKFKEL